MQINISNRQAYLITAAVAFAGAAALAPDAVNGVIDAIMGAMP